MSRLSAVLALALAVSACGWDTHGEDAPDNVNVRPRVVIDGLIELSSRTGGRLFVDEVLFHAPGVEMRSSAVPTQNVLESDPTDEGPLLFRYDVSNPDSVALAGERSWNLGSDDPSADVVFEFAPLRANRAQLEELAALNGSDVSGLNGYTALVHGFVALQDIGLLSSFGSLPGNSPNGNGTPGNGSSGGALESGDGDGAPADNGVESGDGDGAPADNGVESGDGDGAPADNGVESGDGDGAPAVESGDGDGAPADNGVESGDGDGAPADDGVESGDGDGAPADNGVESGDGDGAPADNGGFGGPRVATGPGLGFDDGALTGGEELVPFTIVVSDSMELALPLALIDFDSEQDVGFVPMDLHVDVNTLFSQERLDDLDDEAVRVLRGESGSVFVEVDGEEAGEAFVLQSDAAVKKVTDRARTRRESSLTIESDPRGDR